MMNDVMWCQRGVKARLWALKRALEMSDQEVQSQLVHLVVEVLSQMLQVTESEVIQGDMMAAWSTATAISK